MPDQNSTTDVNVTHDSAAHRFQAQVPGGTAVVMYQMSGNDVVFTHTEVPEQSRGQGVADELARTALQWARQQGLHVIPECPFIAAYMRRHGQS